MFSGNLSPFQRQVGRASRRLFCQTFLQCLIWCVSGALLASAAWFVAQPHLAASLSSWWRLGVGGGVLLAGVMLAALLALRRAPSPVTAALLLDERFGLKERVTTSLTLAPEQEKTPAGQALLADVNQCVGQLDVGSRFPVRLTWTGTLMPIGAAVLAIAAFSYEPAKTQATAATRDTRDQAPANAQEIQQKINQLKKLAHKQKPTDKAVSDRVKEIEAELDKIASKPHDTKEQLRERVKELSSAEEKIKNRAKELADRARTIQQQLQQLDRMSEKGGVQEGPAKELQKALAQGHLQEAKQELKKLADKLRKKQLSKKEKDQLARQMMDIQKKLERLSRRQDKRDELQKLQKEGKLDADTLQRELDQLQKDGKKNQDLDDLAKKLGQCQKCLKKGDGEGAAQSLQQARDKLDELSQQQQELQDVQEQLQRLQEAKDSCCKGLGDQPGGNSRNASDKPGGRRPVAPKGPTNSRERKAKVKFDEKGLKIFEGYAPGRSIKGKSPAEIAGEVKQASQEAPEAIEQQPIPKSYQDAAKGYFRNISGQKDKEQKK